MKNKLAHVIFVALVTLVLIAGGHKGQVAFFYIFVWFFPFGGRLSLTSIVLFTILLATYGLTKGSTSLNKEVVLTITESAFRRFSVTQGVGFLARLQMMHDGLFIEGGGAIKSQVFEYIYRTKGGSHPTVFVANVIIEYGYLVAVFVYTIYVAAVTNVAKSIAKFAPKNYFFLWNFFTILFLTGMADFSFRTVVRSGVAVVNILMVGLLLRIHLKSLGTDETMAQSDQSLA